MNVTEQILFTNKSYGSSDSTIPSGLAASKSLNFAKGATLQKPAVLSASVRPSVLKFQDSVGLFGTENYFVRVDVNITDTAANAISVREQYLPLEFGSADVPPLDTYVQAVRDSTKDLTPVNTYDPAVFSNALVEVSDPFISVDVFNLGVGNIYIDSNLDVRLYTAQKEEHPYPTMYLPLRSHFYLGIHARETRRLPYNIELHIGDDYVSRDDVPDSRLIPSYISS